MACTTERTTPEMTGLPAFPVAASTITRASSMCTVAGKMFGLSAVRSSSTASR